METVRGRAPLWLLPGGTDQPLPTVHRDRFLLGVALGLLALIAAVPAYMFLAPESVWNPESLLVLLLVLSFVSYSAAVEVRGTVTLDASFVAALVAVVFLGPLPAACVYAAPEISSWLERGRIVSLLSNTAAAAWGAWVAAWTLEALTAGIPLHPTLGDLPAVAAAGAVLLTVSYFVTTMLVSIAWEGLKLRPLVEQEMGELVPACAVLIVVGTLTTILYEEVGPPGLIPLATLVVLPRLLVPRLSQSRDPARLDQGAATSLYARAIAEALELDRDQKRVLLDAATHLGDHKRLTRIEDFEGVMQTVLYCRERWDGEGGFPGVLSGEAIPVESRVLAVAEQLAQLTARDTRGLSPQRAVATLVPRAGGEFDPRVIAAAQWVIEEDILVSPRAERPPGAHPARAVRS